MPAWLEKKVSVGNVLTVFSILIAAFAAITTWRTEIQTRQRSQADGVRKAAAEVVAKMERRYEISQWIFEDIQPDVVAAAIMAAGQNSPPLAQHKPLDPKDDTIRRSHVFAARDFLYKQIAEAHQRNRKRQLDEQIETSYIGLYSYVPQARKFIQDAGSALGRADSEMTVNLQTNVQAQILNFTGNNVFDTTLLGNCLRWAVQSTKRPFDQTSSSIVREVVDALTPILLASDETILRGLSEPGRFGLDRLATTGQLTKIDPSPPPASECMKLPR